MTTASLTAFPVAIAVHDLLTTRGVRWATRWGLALYLDDRRPIRAACPAAVAGVHRMGYGIVRHGKVWPNRKCFEARNLGSPTVERLRKFLSYARRVDRQ